MNLSFSSYQNFQDQTKGMIVDPRFTANAFETSATRRLLQTRTINRPVINVKRILELPLDQMPELNPTVKVASLEVVKDVERMLSTTPSLGMIEFTPIMYGWELYVGAGICARDWGGLVFTDESQTKYLLVHVHKQASDLAFSKYEENVQLVVKQQTLRFLALLEYLPVPKLEWLHSTYVTTSDTFLSPSILQPTSDPSTKLDHRVLRLTSNDLRPCLSLPDLRRIDAVLRLFGEQPDPSSRVRVLLLPGQTDHCPLLFTGTHALDCDKYFGFATTRGCQWCHVEFEASQLKACSACFSDLYCSSACQAKDWPNHKGQCIQKPKK